MNTNPTRFGQYGYCLFRGVLTAEEIAGIRTELDQAIANLPEKQVVYKDGEDREVDARPEYMTEPHPKNPYWLDLCRHPRVLDAVEAVLGPDLILIMSHLIVKPPEDGLPVAWHQDNTYWHSIGSPSIRQRAPTGACRSFPAPTKGTPQWKRSAPEKMICLA